MNDSRRHWTPSITDISLLCGLFQMRLIYIYMYFCCNPPGISHRCNMHHTITAKILSSTNALMFRGLLFLWTFPASGGLLSLRGWRIVFYGFPVLWGFIVLDEVTVLDEFVSVAWDGRIIKDFNGIEIVACAKQSHNCISSWSLTLTFRCKRWSY